MFSRSRAVGAAVTWSWRRVGVAMVTGDTVQSASPAGPSGRERTTSSCTELMTRSDRSRTPSLTAGTASCCQRLWPAAGPAPRAARPASVPDASSFATASTTSRSSTSVSALSNPLRFFRPRLFVPSFVEIAVRIFSSGFNAPRRSSSPGNAAISESGTRASATAGRASAARPARSCCAPRAPTATTARATACVCPCGASPR